MRIDIDHFIESATRDEEHVATAEAEAEAEATAEEAAEAAAAMTEDEAAVAATTAAVKATKDGGEEDGQEEADGFDDDGADFDADVMLERKNFIVLDIKSMKKARDDVVADVSDTLHVSATKASMLLRLNGWNKEKLVPHPSLFIASILLV